MVRDYFLDFVYKTKKKKNVRIWLLSLLKDLCKQSATSKYVFTQPTKHTLSFLPTMTWTYQEVLNLFFILFFTIHNTTEHGLTHQNQTQFPQQLVSPIRKLPQTSYLYPSEGRQTENHNQRKLIKLITWTTALSNSMKLWAMPCRATQDGQVMVESSDKTWSTGEGNGKTLQYSCLKNPMNSMKRQKDGTLKDELLRSVGVQYAIGEKWRNNSRKNEETEPK